MARQEELFAQTITDLKRVLKKSHDDSESDDAIEQATNRGNKLKRKAKHVQEGRLDQANPYTAYKKRITYNDYIRIIISKNPGRVDNDGDVIDLDDERAGSEIEQPADDAYRDVDLLGRLMPLTSAAELKDHPSLSIPYTEKRMEEIIRNAQEMVQREQNALWRMKQLAISLRGDSAWMPVEIFENEDDLNLVASRYTYTALSSTSSAAMDAESVTVHSLPSGEDTVEIAPSHQADEPSWGPLKQQSEDFVNDFDSSGNTVAATSLIQQMPNSRSSEVQNGPNKTYSKMVRGGSAGNVIDFAREHEAASAVEVQGFGEADAKQKERNESERMGNFGSGQRAQPPNSFRVHADTGIDRTEDDIMDDVAEDDDVNPTHRMTTRAKAQQANSPSISRQSSPDSAPLIDPFYQVVPVPYPGRDLGLPHDEADETRRLLSAYIQKQEEVVRGSWKLYNGLLKAKRLRDAVMEWCTAEGHIGEMSDGEDWYDKEKWGLMEDLEKGKDIEEEEVTATGKKTRNRRNVA